MSVCVFFLMNSFNSRSNILIVKTLKEKEEVEVKVKKRRAAARHWLTLNLYYVIY